MIVKGPQDVQVGGMYMYRRFASGVQKLECGICTCVSETGVKFKDPNRYYWNETEVSFVYERYPHVVYTPIADFDKRIFKAYNDKVDRIYEELGEIWNGKLGGRARGRGRCRGRKFSFWKRWFK